MSWLFTLEHYNQSGPYELGNVENNKKKPLGEHNGFLKAQRTIAKKPSKKKIVHKKKHLKKNNKSTTKLGGIFKKIEDTKSFVGGLLTNNTTQNQSSLNPSIQFQGLSSCTNIQNEETSNMDWYEEVTDGFPLPDFVIEKNKILSPLTKEQQKLPLPITPIQKNKPIMSPTRPRTPGSGILSPRTNDGQFLFQSPTFRDLYNQSNETVFSPINEPSSFCLLDEQCGYDSDDYFDEDIRFPTWSRQPLSELDLKISNKTTYDKLYTARSIQSLEPDHLLKGNSSIDYDKTLDKSKASYANIDDFQIGKPIGSGKFGTIYLARSRKEKQFFVAIKVMFKTNLTKGHITQLLREIKHLDTLRCENIISLYDFFHDEDRIYLIMEYANGGDLFHSLVSNKIFSEEEAASIFKQALNAIKTCHDHGIVHRDIKPENFVWGVGHTLKLIDFGWSAPCEVGERRRTLCGTLDYLPPEMVTGKAYGQMADTWCLGVLLYELLIGSPPFEDPDYLITKVKIRHVSYEIPDFVSIAAKRLIEDILKSDPLSRPTLEQLLSNPWVNNSSLL